METTLGLQREDNDPKGKWVRTRRPRTLADAADLLASVSGLSVLNARNSAPVLLAYQTTDEEGRSLLVFRFTPLLVLATYLRRSNHWVSGT
jgi:hypothetical protein